MSVGTEFFVGWGFRFDGGFEETRNRAEYRNVEFDEDVNESQFDGIPFGLDELNNSIISLALQTNTDPERYRQLTLWEFQQRIKAYNAVAEQMKYNRK